MQKSLATLCVTVLGVGAAWFFTDGSLDRGPTYLSTMASSALLGTSFAAYFWFKRAEAAKTKEDSKFIRKRIDDDRQGRSWTSRIGFNIRQLLSGAIVLLGLLLVLAGVVVLILQIVGYLKSGEWRPVPVLQMVTPYFPWLRNPQSWLGLHKIVVDAINFVPVSVLLAIVGGLIAGFGSAIKGRVQRNVL